MPTLRVYLFGGLRLFHGEAPLPPFPTQKTRALFAYLATFRAQSHPRATVAATLWPETPAARAGRSLNTTLWRLRRTLPPGYIAAQGDQLAFLPTKDCWLDTAAFEQLLQEAGLSDDPFAPAPLPTPRLKAMLQAVDLYRGDLLEGLDEPWALVEAERLRSRYLAALQWLLAHHRAVGEHETALDYARRLLAVDPLHEDTHRQAMALYQELGRPDEALAQYERCRQLLRGELAVAPLPETAALYERIRAGCGRLAPAAPLPEPSPRRPLPRTPFDDLGRGPLVGREREQSALQARIEAAGRGRGGLLLIQGQAGLGKTRLLQEAVRYAEGRGWLVLRGACHELRQPPPYQGWREALRPAPRGLDRQRLAQVSPAALAELRLLAPEIGRFCPHLPPPAPGSPAERQARFRQAVLRALTDLSRLGPCLVALEDLHWADEAGLETLGYVAPRLEGLPVLCLNTARPPESAAPLQAFLHRLKGLPTLEQLLLSPLGWNETVRLVQELLGWDTPDPLFAARLYQETRGNPFFIIEALKALFERGLLSWNAHQQWDVSRVVQAGSEIEWPLPRGIRRAVQQRLEYLAGGSRQLLELAAVLGGAAEPALLRRASGWTRGYFREATDDLLRRQLLVESDDHLELVHDTLRQVLYRGIPAPRRRALHERAGETLEELAPERIEELAHHFVLAQQPHRALPYCLQAGRRAGLLHAFQPALAYYSWALEAAGQVGGEAGRRAALEAHEERGKVLDLLGDGDRALADFAAMEAHAVALGDGPAAARAVRRTAWARGDLRGEWEEALRGTRRAYDLAAQAGSKREMAIALLDVGACLGVRGEPARALEALRGALALADETDDRGARAASLQYMVLPYDLLGDYAAGVAAAQEAVAIWCAMGNRRHAAASTLIDEGFLHLRWGNLAEAERALRQADAHIKAVGVEAAFPLRQVGWAAVHRGRGQVDAGFRLLQQAAAAETARGPNRYLAAVLHAERGRLEWAVGRPVAALQDLQEALEMARASEARPLAVETLNDLGRARQALGQDQQALAHHQEALDLATQAGLARGQARGLAGAGRAELALGRTQEGLAHLRQAVRRAHSLGPRSQGETAAALAAGCLEVWALAPALALARRSGRLAAQMGHQPLLRESLFLEGRALAGLGLLAAAESALRRALAAAPDSPLLRWEVLLHLAHLLAEAGRPDEAVCSYQQARALVEKVLDELTDEEPRRAFAGRPDVWALRGADAPPQPGQVTAALARLGAPTGRPLRPEERVAVLWSAPPDPPGQDKVTARRERLLRLLSAARVQGGDPGEGDLAQALGVSVRTVRGDVAALRAAGRPVRTRGTRGEPSTNKDPNTRP